MSKQAHDRDLPGSLPISVTIQTIRFFVGLIIGLLLAAVSAPQGRAQNIDGSLKDPGALRLLDALFSHNGWTPEDQSSTFIANGQSNNPSSQDEHDSHRVAISVFGANRYKYDDLTADFHIVKNGPSAVFIHLQQTTLLNLQQAQTIEAWPFPFFTPIRLYRRPEVGLRTLSGTDNTASGNAEIEIDIPSSVYGCCSASVGSRQTRYIATIQAGQLESLRQLSPKIPAQQAPQETVWKWADYRIVGGQLMPFHSDYLRGADDVLSLTLDDVTPSTSISSSLFAIQH